MLRDTAEAYVNRSAAILLAIATALPVVYMFYFFTAFDSMSGQMTQEEMQAKFDLLFRLHLGTMALIGSPTAHREAETAKAHRG